MSAAEQADIRPDDPPALVSALQLLSMRLWPVPITAPDDPHATAPGKQPIGMDWGKVRHTPESLRAVYAQHPGAGVGLKLGKEAGVMDVEIDDRASGEPTLAAMLGGHDLKTKGWDSRRGSHRLVQWDDRIARYGRTILKIGGVEIRAGSAEPGGKQIQSVVPPTVNVDGTPRVWNGIETIAALPDEFFAFLDNHFSQIFQSPASHTIPLYSPSPGDWSVLDRARAYLKAIEPAVSGQRGHDKTFWAVCQVGPGFDLSPEAFLPLLLEWNASCQPPWSEKELAHKIQDAYSRESRRGWLLNSLDRVTPLTPLTPYDRCQGKPVGSKGVKGVNGVTADDENEAPIPARVWPAPLREAAYFGLVGEFVRLIDPFTESDPVAVLLQLLVGVGNVVGRKACFAVEADVHYLNLFACIVGLSSKGRKGTSWATVRWILALIDEDWSREHVLGGLVSGEGMIWAVRDPISKHEPIKHKGRVVEYQDVKVDPGIADKRALFLETEMGRVLKVMGREGNTLSDLIRQAWETGHLRTATKNNPAKATGAHISIIGHITTSEAAKYLTETEAGNGFGNRFLWACVKRSKLLPRGAKFDREAVTPLVDRLRYNLETVTEFAAGAPDGHVILERDEEASVYWDSLYGELSEGKPGLLGSILGRAEAQVMRLACLYALLDGRFLIRLEHIDAALALWRYCEDSARFTFGDSLGDRDADHLLSALRSTPHGLTRTQIRSDVFSRNKSADEIARTLGRLLEAGKVRSEKVTDTGGAPVTHWFALSGATP